MTSTEPFPFAAVPAGAPDPPRYCLVQDDSGHDYLIPAARLDEWFAWRGSEAEENGDVPTWARALGCARSRITFEAPAIDGEPFGNLEL